jgi:primosomal protein N' (replication factor Y)
MSVYCEVVVDRPILRHRVLPDADYPEERDVQPVPPWPGGQQDEAGGWAEFNPLEVTFSYVIPEDLREQVALGQLVEVPFRSGSLQGVVVGLSAALPDVEPRSLISILDPTPVLTPVQITLARWLSTRYLAPLSDCIWLFLPPGIRRPPQTVVEAVPDKTPPPDGSTARAARRVSPCWPQGQYKLAEVLDARAHALFLYLRGKEDPTPADELEAEPLKALIDIQLVRTWQRLAPPRVSPQIDRTVELIATSEEIATALPTLGHVSKQADVLLYLAGLDDPLPALDDVLTAVGCTESPVRALAARGWVRLTPKRTLVATTLPGPALETVLAELKGAPAQRAALSFLRDHPGPVETPQVGISTTTLAVLEAKGYVRRWTEPATLTLTLDPDEVLDAVLELRGAARYADVLDMLAREEGRVWVGWVYAQTDATLNTLRDLAEAGLVALDEARRWRDPLADQSFVLEEPPPLTPEQAKVWEAVERGSRGVRERGSEGAGEQGSRGARNHLVSNLPTFQSTNPQSLIPNPQSPAFLLHGVTGSGKTEIYLRAVAEVLRRGQGAIVLVPEIALATQTVRRVVARFPGKVAVWHSGLSLGERFDTWGRVRAGELPVVVGARSALFAPVPNLGLVVVDEEHEPAYKQARSPRYHAREVALQLGRLTGATVILGSATPDVATFRRAERGELTLLTLPKRVLAHRQHMAIQVMAAQTRVPPLVARPVGPGFYDLRTLPLPPVEVVDLREELKAGNRTIFSRALQRAIRKTLDAGQQVLLFLNRRGAATFVLCRDCGHVMRCSRCEVPLTFHAGDEALICHHCSRRQPNPDRCPACKSSRIRYFGLGTERVEAVVREMFPDARPLRWDLDTARARGSHAAFFQQLIDGRANVLVGTQMIAKGLDLPLVTLVGVVSADTALYLPDFRAAERTFQLLMQVAGRAGRSPLGGRVILQTYNPDLPVIRAAAAHDYAAFYRDELAARREGRYPPFKRLARLIFTGSGTERAQREAERMAQALRTHIARRGEPGVEIIGPAPCFYRRLRGQHRWHILVRANEPEALLRPIPLPLGWRVDVDPMDLL